MARSLKERLQEYVLDLRTHAERLEKGEVRPGVFFQAFFVETRKLVYRASKGDTTNGRKEAIDFVKRGMVDFNEKRYKEAEGHFCRAIDKDANYGRAHAYLGNALYKQKRISEAIAAWNKAIEVEPNSDAADLAKAKLQKVGPPPQTLANAVENLVAHPPA